MKRFCNAFTVWGLLLAGAIVAFSLLPAAPALAAPGPGELALPLIGIAGIVNIRNLFTREAIIRYLEILGPAFPTVVCDTVFTDRPQQPGPLIGADIIQQSVKAMPLARRGSRSINIGGPSGKTEFYAPLPIHPDIAITGADLNDLRLFSQSPNSSDLLGVWARNKADVLRRTVRVTCEGMCAVALSGKLEWPVQLEGGGFETYEVDYGSPLTLDPAVYKYWDDAQIKIKDVQELLINLNVLFQQNGTGQKKIYWAGKTAFLALYDLVSKVYSTSKLALEITEDTIVVNGTKVSLRSELYWDPQAKVFKPIIPDNTLKVIDLAAGHRLPYASIDDLDGGLQPMPFFIKPVKTENPSGYSLIAESKPLPVVNTLGIADIVVITPA